MPLKYLISISSTFLIVLTILISSCSNKSTTKSKDPSKSDKALLAGPPVIIYKTRSDYYKNVPVILSEDKSMITSFPGRSDIMYKGNFAYPTALREGYLLDNRGISKNVAFLDYTYEDYGKLEKTPDAGELYKHIIDDDPITEMYHCGSRYDFNNLVDELNSKIASNDFKSFKKLK